MSPKLTLLRLTRSRAIPAALLALPVLLLNPVDQVQIASQGLQVAFSTAVAQDDEEPQRRTRRAMAVSDGVNKRLASVSELMNPEDEGDEPDLQAALREAQGINTSRWNEFEQAQLYNLMGNIYVQMENYPQAISNYTKYINTESVPLANVLNVKYYLAQLYLATENYRGAIQMLEEYIAQSEVVGADHYYRLGQAYYLDENLAKALPNIEKAVDIYEGSDRVPPEGLYQYQMSLYHGREDYAKAVQVLEKMVRHYPKISTWNTLASLYGAVGRDKDQLHAFDTIYAMGGLTKEKELRRLASLYLENEYPYKAAKILAKGVNDDIVEPTSKNMELLGVSWTMAKEMEKAIPAMEDAAKKSSQGDLYARLAQIYLGDDDYQNTIDAGREALRKGGLKKPANVYFNIGIAQYNLDQFDNALDSLKEARKDKTVTSQANTWIRLVESEKNRVEKLEAEQAREVEEENESA